MKKMRLVILANSERHGDRCIAGMCPETGELIRPITAEKSHTIETKKVSHIDLLDEVDIYLAEEPCEDDYQKENYKIINNHNENINWKNIQKYNGRNQDSKNEIRTLLDRNCLESEKLFKEKWKGQKNIPAKEIKNLPPDKKESLWIVKTQATFKKRWENGRIKWKAVFEHDLRRSLPITDPMFEGAPDNQPDRQYIFTVSLSWPYTPGSGRPDEETNSCYLLVAGVIGVAMLV